jgi:hypothetical protein
MKQRTARALAAVVTVIAASATAGGQAPAGRPDALSLPGTDTIKAFIASRIQKNWTQPKTPWGDPDIAGVFTTKDEANTPLERPAEWAGRKMDDITSAEFEAAVQKRQQLALETAPFAGGGEPEEGVAIAVPIHWFDNLAAKNSRPWFVIDPVEGKIPDMTPEGQREASEYVKSRAVPEGAARNRGGRRDTFLDRSLGDRCIVVGGPWILPAIYGNSFQIVQSKSHIVIRQEMVHEARIVPLDGRTMPGDALRTHVGQSRGRWEGNTLVVETTNFRPDVMYRNVSAKNLRLVERFTRIAPQRVEWTMTIDHPSAWPRPWTYSLPMTEDDKQIIHEYACHEGNFGMANLLSAGREADKGKAAK